MEIQLAECYQTLVTDRTLVVELPLAQIQQEGVGCGLFAIANAYELAAGNDLSDISFDLGKMRKFNVWRRVVLNLFHDSRSLLDSMREKLMTSIYFVIVQCQSVRTTWYSASCARNGCT